VTVNADTQIQWRVTWFPFDGPPWEVTKTGSEARVHQLADDNAEFNPIVESRRVTATPWVIEPRG
jgi:hypothetical protein